MKSTKLAVLSCVLALFAAPVWCQDVISGEGGGALLARPVPLEERTAADEVGTRMESMAGASSAAKSLACGIYISGVWNYTLNPNDPGYAGNPHAYVYGNASPNDLRINNDAISCENPTGTLRLEYWAVTPNNVPAYRGAPFFGIRLAIFPANGQLYQGFSFVNINGNAPYTLPPFNTYYIVMSLSEFNSTGACANADFYCTTDSLTSFSTTNIGVSTLSVSRNGTGSGTVTGVVNAGSPYTAINCGSTCSASVFGGYSVTLTATPTAGSTFAGWSGPCSGTGSCTVSMSTAQSVSATFNVAAPTTYALNISKVGNGTVTTSPAGINCGATCSASFTTNSMVAISAAPAIGYNFTGWTGDCAGTGSTCNIQMLTNRNVTANFATLPVISTLVTPTDFNDDGKSDILFRNTSTGQVYRIFMNGLTAGSGAIAYTEPNTAWKIVGDADFNGDGVTDLLWRNSTSGQVYVMLFNASGLPSGVGAVVATEPNAAWKIVHTPDIDGDGKADILWWNSTTGQVWAMLLNGAAIASQGPVYTEPNTAWKIAAVGDFAFSGKTNQLLWRNSTTGQLFVLTVTFSGGVFSSSGIMIYAEPNTAWKVIGAPDLNGDRHSDILWRNDTTGQVYAMLMNGTTISSQAMVYTEPNLAWKIVAQGDYNGDGKADLLYRNETTGQVYMILMSGLTTGSAGIVYTEPNLAWKTLGPYEYAQ